MLARKTLTSYHWCFDTFHLSDRPGGRVELAKALDNILIMLEQIRKSNSRLKFKVLQINTKTILTE
jgi:hypothetical protein